MKEESKYYTPETEEFHVGFEYEYLANGYDWITHTINNKADLIECIEDLEDNHIRVKYLDKEDIESLGWVNGETKALGGFIIDNEDFKNSKGFYQMYEGMFIENEGLFLQIHSNETSDYIFQGIIKNKSELKRLMKQLDIEL